MENATKALLIAAGVMLSLMILSLLLIAYNQISSYYGDKAEIEYINQLAEFNSVFENYNRKNLRGSEVISLMNRIIDYNERNSYQAGTNYRRISVTIKVGDSSIINQFKWPGDTGETIILSQITNNSPGAGTAKEKDKQLIAITNTESNIITQAKNIGINLNADKLQKLSANISNITADVNTEPQSAIKRDALLKNILGSSYTTDINKIKEIQKYTCKYYQYTQFKRAYFNCTALNYDEDTGRVCEMKFEVSTKGGLVVFN